METREKQDVRDLVWWQRPKYLAATAALTAAVSFAAFVATTLITNARVDERNEVILEIGELAENNAAAIQQIKNNQAGIDELVAFVRDIQDNPTDDATQQAVDRVVALLCASSDPVRQAACAELQGAP